MRNLKLGEADAGVDVVVGQERRRAQLSQQGLLVLRKVSGRVWLRVSRELGSEREKGVWLAEQQRHERDSFFLSFFDYRVQSNCSIRPHGDSRCHWGESISDRSRVQISSFTTLLRTLAGGSLPTVLRTYCSIHYTIHAFTIHTAQASEPLEYHAILCCRTVHSC